MTSSLKGKEVISEQSELSLGSLGVTSYSKAYHYIIEKSDLIIFLGAGFNERTSYYVWKADLLKNKKIAQIDNNIEQLEKVFKADVAILGDLRVVLNSLFTILLSQVKEQQIERKKLTGVLDEYRVGGSEKSHSDFSELGSRFPLVKAFFSELESCFPKNLMLFDDNIIFAIIGDGGFQMCCMEIMTGVNYDLPMTIIMFNNSTMGLIRKNQFQQYDKRYINCDFVNPDYEFLSKSFGMKYYKVSSGPDLKGLLAGLDYQKSINLVEIMIDKDIFPNYSSGR